MPKYTKVKPVGVDIVVQKYQEKLWRQLLLLWNLVEADYISYGRCYRNQRPSGYVPEMFQTGTTLGTEYKELFLDDKVKVTSFFGCETENVTDTIFTSQGHLIFIVDLTKLGKTAQHRPDEEVRQDVYNILAASSNRDLQVTGIITGIDKVFSEYTGWKATAGGVNYTDMHPKHCFRINFTATFTPNNSCLPVFN